MDCKNRPRPKRPSFQKDDMDARWSYRTLPAHDGWCWQLVWGQVVILQGVAVTHAAAIREVVEAFQLLQAAALH